MRTSNGSDFIPHGLFIQFRPPPCGVCGGGGRGTSWAVRKYRRVCCSSSVSGSGGLGGIHSPRYFYLRFIAKEGMNGG